MWRELVSGSATDRIMNCSASVAMCSKLMNLGSEYAEEGTSQHKVACKILKDEFVLPALVTDAVRVYVDFVKRLSNGLPLYVEERLPFLDTKGGGLDCYAIDDKTAYIFDFKYGLIPLYAPENGQLAFYACCLKEKYPHITAVQCWLIQPRVEGDFDDSPNITSWTLTYQTLAKWKRDISAALEQVELATTIKAGSWCRFCDARAGCPAHLSYAARAEQEFAERSEIIPMPTVEDWLPAAVPNVARIYKLKEKMTKWFTKAEEFLLAVGLNGHEDWLNENGLELGPRRTNRKWRSEDGTLSTDEVARALVRRGLAEPWKPMELVGIGKAEEAKINIDDLIYKPAGEPGLKVRR